MASQIDGAKLLLAKHTFIAEDNLLKVGRVIVELTFHLKTPLFPVVPTVLSSEPKFFRLLVHKQAHHL